jgi:hypothetical protein
LLREVQPKWEGKVEVQASQYGYLSIHRIDDEPPYKKSVTVLVQRRGDGVQLLG